MSQCKVERCSRPIRARGWCNMHYQRALKGLDMDAPPRGRYTPVTCRVEGCGRFSYRKDLCSKHYQRLLAGTDLERPEPDRAIWSDGYVSRQGYRVRSRTVDGKYERKLEHRIRMEEHLGRPLLRHENVHHINGDRLDNRLENLELWSTLQPKGQRIEDKLAWAKEILRIYGDKQEFAQTVREQENE